MKFKIHIVALALVLSIQFLQAQKTIHNYAYVVIPEQFSFQDEPGQYQLNELMKFLFKKEGMTAFLDTEQIPNEYRLLNCGGLNLKATKNSSMMKAKVTFTLSDCSNKVVFTSVEGISRQKEFKKAYQESVRNAFESFSELNYSYVPVAATSSLIAVSNMEKETATLADFTVYTNEDNLSLKLKSEKNGFVGYVATNSDSDYSLDEMICKLKSTSLVNVYKIQWIDRKKEIVQTIGYFDQEGNLKIDFLTENGIEVITFFQKK